MLLFGKGKRGKAAFVWNHIHLPCCHHSWEFGSRVLCPLNQLDYLHWQTAVVWVVLHNWLKKVLCCAILQLVCTQQRNVTSRNNAIKRIQSMRQLCDYSVLVAIPFSVFIFLNFFSFSKFSYPLPSTLPLLCFSLNISEMLLLLPSPLLSQHQQRECSEHISCLWGQADLQHQSCACIQTSAWPCGDTWRVLSAAGALGSAAGELQQLCAPI